MEGITTLAPSLGFDLPHDAEVDALIPIHSQDEESHLESESLLVPPSNDVLTGGEGGDDGSDEQGSPETPKALGGSGDEPVVDMEFDSPEDARAFYSAYADRAGFRVRNSKSFTSRVDDTVIMRRFVCSRQGQPTKKDPYDLTKKRRNRVSSRQGCKAMLQVNRRENGRWAISRFALEHCHELGGDPMASPSMQKKLAKKPWELLAFGCASHSEAQQSGLGPGGGVAQSLLEYFKKMQAENPAFFYAIQVDGSNCISNVFWADARARMAYGYFGDVVFFDLSCKKNKRMVPFAAFTGVNHHRQLSLFGCAFMTDESEASFTWLFETWLSLMGRRSPLSFVMPADGAVESAAGKVFPNFRHRFCKRDVFHKCKEKLANVYAMHPAFKGDLKRCVNESSSLEELELCWSSLIRSYDLESDMWLHSLYSVREKWIPVCLKDAFFGELPGLPKLETMRQFFRRHSITTTTLRDLVAQLDRAMAGQHDKEIQEDASSLHTRPALKTSSLVEKNASEIYTKTAFDVFQEELVSSSGFSMEKIEEDIISKFQLSKPEDSGVLYIVVYDSTVRRISCSCGMFEFSGILCRHSLRVFLAVGLINIPEEYLLRRWSKNAKGGLLSYEHCGMFQTEAKMASAWRCNDLCRDAIRFAEEGATSALIFKVAKEALQKAFAEIFSARRGPFSG